MDHDGRRAGPAGSKPGRLPTARGFSGAGSISPILTNELLFIAIDNDYLAVTKSYKGNVVVDCGCMMPTPAL
ncbi:MULTISPECIES: hypothetical protein [unclassified Parafrankia]|uniref:hypothetical protein n=1 Tax=unclassified Parafrankia TaxID=2994368 RepID=UPI00140436FE|nr:MULTISPECIES: hypothetical protein [unclassified Parafrankia]